MNVLNSLTLNEKTYDRFAGNLPKPATAAVGQVLVVAAVDDDGNVTEVEAVDHSSGSGGPFYAVSVKEGADADAGSRTVSVALSVSVTAEDYMA